MYRGILGRGEKSESHDPAEVSRVVKKVNRMTQLYRMTFSLFLEKVNSSVYNDKLT